MTNKNKKLLTELKGLICKYGYWSNEVKDFNSKLDFTTMDLINNIAKFEKIKLN